MKFLGNAAFLWVACSAMLGACSAFVVPSITVSKQRQTLHHLTSTISSVDNGPMLVEEIDEASESEQFNWFKAWYPVVPIEMLDPEKPHQYQLLGMDLVIWKDAVVEGGKFESKKKRPKKAKRTGGQWRVFVDECPHRKVPLSEGRVEDDGSILCSYHAFRFNGTGNLIDVPQYAGLDDFDLEQVQKNPKSQCNSFPTRIIDGVLWVWPETGDDARLESLLTEPKHYKLPDGVDADRAWYGPWNYRELPYSADYFIENVMDPAHVSVSHHGIVGSRYGDQTMKVIPGDIKLSKEGFSQFVTRPGEDGKSQIQSHNTFHAPAHVELETSFGEGALQTLELYASPSRPGFCNHVGRMVIVKDKTDKMPPLLKQFTAPLPKWLNHVLAASFLNQDAVFLHAQERYLTKTESYITHTKSDATDYSRAVLPIQADYGVVKFRTWLSKLAGGFIPYKYQGKNPVMPDVDPYVCFDQWNSHTSKCQICLRALSNLKKARIASFLVSVMVSESS